MLVSKWTQFGHHLILKVLKTNFKLLLFLFLTGSDELDCGMNSNFLYFFISTYCTFESTGYRCLFGV